METPSSWKETKTFFPLLLYALEQSRSTGNACIVGASDGKFVIPLAQRGWNVTAIDNDYTALFGGEIEFPKGNLKQIPGLRGRAEELDLQRQIELAPEDMYEFVPLKAFDVIFTSCSWHYSKNHDRPLKNFIRQMQKCIGLNGIFCAEYMMPVEAKHFDSEHYLYEGQIRQYFERNEWEILEEFYTAPFRESPHLGNLVDHVHRMGFFMARKLQPLA